MSDQHAGAAPRRHRSLVVGALVSVVALLGLVVGGGPAGAATEDAQLSLTGVVDGNNPTGGSSLGVHPGTTITFSASAAPTQKIKDLASGFVLGGLLNSVLGTTDFQVTADFSHLPGGHSNTVLTGSKKATFHFSHLGSYAFTYKAQQVSTTTSILGGSSKNVTTIKLDGNQAKKAGVELNASNSYVGRVVVSKSPKNGISVQLPSTQIHPKVAGHQLPKIKLPGATTPKIPTTVPNLSKTANKPTSKQAKANSKPASGKATTRQNPDSAGLLPVPARVVPGGYGNTTYGGGGGFYGSALTGTGGTSGLASLQMSMPNGKKSTTSGGTGDAQQSDAAQAASSDKHDPAAQLPIVLAIIAIIALALVASTYARLFLLRRSSSA